MTYASIDLCRNTNFTTETWYDLGTSGDTLLSTSFSSYTSAASVAFSDIDGVGFIYEYATNDTAQKEYRLGGWNVVAVPEPSTGLLLLVSAIGLLTTRRRGAARC